MAWSGMTYRIDFYREGAVVSVVKDLEDLSAAKRTAEKEVATRDAEIALVIDVDGTGTEVASIRQDTMVWDDE